MEQEKTPEAGKQESQELDAVKESQIGTKGGDNSVELDAVSISEIASVEQHRLPS